MRVLFVSPAAELGGAERCLLDFVVALRTKSGVEPELLAFTDGPLVSQVRALGVRARVLEAPSALTEFGESGQSDAFDTLKQLSGAGWQAARFLRQLRHELASRRPDVVHSNGMKAHLLAGLIAPSHARFVVHLHDFIGARKASKWLLPGLAALRRHAVFIANSRAVAQDFQHLAPRADVRTIYNVVDTDAFCPGPAQPDWLAGAAGLALPTAETVSFGLVGTYARWKGHGLFIEAAGRFCALHPEAALRFYVVGGPIYKTRGSQVEGSELLNQARAAGIEARLGLVPFQEDVARVYRALDVVVHASTQPEPFGRTIVEAMACARPVIVSQAGGAAELFCDEREALGFAPGDANALAAAMSRMLDSALRQRLGRTAREHAVERFGCGRLRGELLQAYLEPPAGG